MRHLGVLLAIAGIQAGAVPGVANGATPAPRYPVATVRTATAVDLSWMPPRRLHAPLAGYEVIVDGTVARRVSPGVRHVVVGSLAPARLHRLGVRARWADHRRSRVAAAGWVRTVPEPQGRWVPVPGEAWQFQYDGQLDLSVAAAVYDLDHEATTAMQVSILHAMGRRAVCYIDAGTWESYRRDAAAFPPQALLGAVDGWPDERWLDIRKLDAPVGPTGTTIRHLLVARIDECARKGFDAVDPDWQGLFLEPTGVHVSASRQLTFNRFLAQVAQARGLAAGLKNDREQAAAMEPYVDFAVDEQCRQFSECAGTGTRQDPGWARFVAAGKPVINIEYAAEVDTCTPIAGITSIRKHRSLDAWIGRC